MIKPVPCQHAYSYICSQLTGSMSIKEQKESVVFLAFLSHLSKIKDDDFEYGFGILILFLR
jgi:hypothetical protein